MYSRAQGISNGGALLLSILAVFIFLGGCAGKKAAVKNEEVKKEAELTRKEASKAYFDELKKWTSGKKIYEGVESRLYITATYKTEEFRKAYIERYAKSYELDESYKKALLERETDQAEKYNEFFFTAYTPEYRWNDFNRPDSVWKLYLEDSEGNSLKPISITKVDGSDPIIREFFPYFDLWSYGYIVRFPKYSETGTEPIPGPGTKNLKLIVTGVLAKGELEWRLK